MHPAFASSRWPPWFADLSRPYAACVKGGSGKHMFGLSLFRPSRKPNISTSGEERFKYPPPPHLGEQDNSNALPQGLQRQSNPKPMPCPPPLLPRRLYIDRCIRKAKSEQYRTFLSQSGSGWLIRLAKWNENIIVITLSHLRALHDALRETFLKVTNI